MTKEDEKRYQDTAVLRRMLRDFAGQKFRLDCGHHITFNHPLGNNITIYNGKELKIICSQCGY